MIKYFEFKFGTDYDNQIKTYASLIEDTINNYAEENGLEIISATCYKDEGIFVVFRKRTTW